MAQQKPNPAQNIKYAIRTGCIVLLCIFLFSIIVILTFKPDPAPEVSYFIPNVPAPDPEPIPVEPIVDVVEVRAAIASGYHGHSMESIMNPALTPPIDEPPQVIIRVPMGFTYEFSENFFHYDKYYEVRTSRFETVPMPLEWQQFTFICCQKWEVPYELILAVMGMESSFDVFIGERSDKYGNRYYGPGMVHIDYSIVNLQKYGIELCTYEGGVEAVAFIMREKLLEFNNDYSKALIAYNMGSYGAQGLFNKGITATDYSKRVLELLDGLLIYKATQEE